MKLNPVFAAGLVLAVISLTFSAHGLVQLFAGASIGIYALAGGLELAKVMSTIWLIGNWRWRPLPVALAATTVVLVLISTVGIYGYLGQAYGDRFRTAVEGTALDGEARATLAALEADRAQLWKQVDDLPVTYASARERMLVRIQPRIASLDSAIAEQRQLVQIGAAAVEVSRHDAGQLRYAASTLGVSDDQLARLLITALATLLDPLAVLLVLASGVHVGHSRRLTRPVPDTTDRKVVDDVKPRPHELRLPWDPPGSIPVGKRRRKVRARMESVPDG